MTLNLAQIFAIVAVLIGIWCASLLGKIEDQRRALSDLKLEMQNRARIELADDRARARDAAGRAEVEAILRDFVRENAVAPVSEACRADPAIERAYDTVERMRDARKDALRSLAR